MNFLRKALNAFISYVKGKKQRSSSREAVLLPIRDMPGSYAFYCPGCKTSHVVNTDPKRAWPCHSITGSADRPTIRASVLANPKNLPGAPRCHSYVTDGKIRFLEDCTHDLAGRTMELLPT